MTAMAYVVGTAAAVVLWWVVSNRLPRLGLVGNAVGVAVVIDQVLRWRNAPSLIDPVFPELEYALGFGVTLLMLLTVGIGFIVALAGLVEARRERREACTDPIPRATIWTG